MRRARVPLDEERDTLDGTVDPQRLPREEGAIRLRARSIEGSDAYNVRGPCPLRHVGDTLDGNRPRNELRLGQSLERGEQQARGVPLVGIHGDDLEILSAAE